MEIGRLGKMRVLGKMLTDLSGRGHPLSGTREAWSAPNVSLATVLPPHVARPTIVGVRRGCRAELVTAGRVRRACDDAPLSVPVRLCDAPYLLPPPAPLLSPRAVGRELGLFSCSIPPSFVLSRHVPMANTTSNLALFWRFSITASTICSHSLATDY